MQAFLDASLNTLTAAASDKETAETEPQPDVEPDPEEAWTVYELVERLIEDLAASDETLPSAVRRRLERLAEVLQLLPPRAPQYARRLEDCCRSLSAEHAQDHPNERAWEILNARCPRVRVLRDDDRQLATSYAFEDYEAPPAPLRNLLALAKLDWDELKSAVAEPGNPQLATLLRRGNRELEQRLHGSWKQTRVSVALEEQGGSLHVYPYDADSDEHSRIEDRSDGFRSFLALLAFTSRHAIGAQKLILGIDEAELHLHYDAQADLVRVLTEQTLVPQIIYTTHSAGCLPEDLGSAIRVLKAVPGDRSVIENGFWSARADEDQSGGFTSLLMAMGAGAVAFTPARRAVMTEGPSDALLLPALFRVAHAWDPSHPIHLQVAGGLAWTPPRRLGALEAEAAHVVYLVDSDEQGQAYKRDLETASVSTSRIFSFRARGLSIEDFVARETYVTAVNLLLHRLRGFDGEGLRATDIPNSGAARAAEDWTAARGVEPVSKTAVAEHVLRLSRTSLAYMYWDPGGDDALPLVRENRRPALVRLYSDLCGALGVEHEVSDGPGT
jgi:hypothetical protein